MFAWLRRFFKKSDDTNIEWPFLVRYTVHAIPCEVCKKPLKNGDILVRFDTLRGESSDIDKLEKISERVVFVHVECLVVIQGKPTKQRPHKSSILLTQQEYDNWLKDSVET